MTWKIFYEIATAAERKNSLKEAKYYIGKTLELCPENLKWKFLVYGGRLELKNNKELKTKKILDTLIDHPNEKSRY